MLRSSATPTFSNRTSPPVTRSHSRLTQIATRNAPLDHSTPKSRGPTPDHIHTVERQLELADDDENFEEFQNTSRFISENGQFTFAERVDTYRNDFCLFTVDSSWIIDSRTSPQCQNVHENFESRSSWYKSLRAYRIRFWPSLSSTRELIMGFITLAILTKYIGEIVYMTSPDWAAEQLQRRVDANFENQNKKINELMNRLEILSHNLEDTRKLHGTRDSYSNDFMEKVGMLEQKISELHDDIQHVKSETKASTELVRFAEVSKQELVSKSATVTSPSRHLPGVNVANSLIGATIDERCSSHAVSAKNSVFFDIISYFMSLKGGYVLLDRVNLQPGEAWCTYDSKATLTVNLARYIIPTAISYQHVKWSGIVPNHAPKTYDVVACRSACCTETTPIVSNCQYGQIGGNEDVQEQFCQIQTDSGIEPVNHVQFRFRENHGNMTKTCAYLVRVYGHPVDIPPEKSEKSNEKKDVKALIFDYLSSIPYFATK